jgi:hypothetical protein
MGSRARSDVRAGKRSRPRRTTSAKPDAAATVQKSARRLPTLAEQRRVTHAVVAWYLRLYHRTGDDPGVEATFCDPAKVGAFSVTRRGLRRGDPEELFRLLVATTMFQRRQDQQILRILRSLPAARVKELTDPARLLRHVDAGACPHMASNAALQGTCDLTKDARRVGVCTANPAVQCDLKVHTVLLKRYGHFGKVPTSAALMVREAGASGILDLKRRVVRLARDPHARAVALEGALCGAWRVSSKIACMYLSALTAPDLSSVAPAWPRGIDWTHFVVVDSNVDAFLASIRYRGPRTYDARRRFVQELARGVDLTALRPRLQRYNPRLVQQAMYLFMSGANRRASARDCSRLGPSACRACPQSLRSRCPVRRA